MLGNAYCDRHTGAVDCYIYLPYSFDNDYEISAIDRRTNGAFN